MKLTYTNGNVLTATREPDDPKYYGTVNAKGESNLLYAVKEHLNALGCDLIKKRMCKDGHLVDECQQYVRTREGAKGLHIALYNTHWAIDGLNDRWNENGEVSIGIVFNYFKEHKDSTLDADMLKAMLKHDWSTLNALYQKVNKA